MGETRAIAEKRLKIRSWRRGIKEMDLILGGYANGGFGDLSDAELALYDVMLDENDHDLFLWASGQERAPERFSALLQKVMASSGAV